MFPTLSLPGVGKTASPQDWLEQMGIVIREVDIDEHHVIITGDAGTSIVPTKHGGVSWSWMSDKRNKDGFYDMIGPSAKKLKTWTPQQIEAWGHKAISKMHRDAGKMGCLICDPEALKKLASQFTFAPAKKRASRRKK